MLLPSAQLNSMSIIPIGNSQYEITSKSHESYIFPCFLEKRTFPIILLLNFHVPCFVEQLLKKRILFAVAFWSSEHMIFPFIGIDFYHPKRIQKNIQTFCFYGEISGIFFSNCGTFCPSDIQVKTSYFPPFSP